MHPLLVSKFCRSTDGSTLSPREENKPFDRVQSRGGGVPSCDCTTVVYITSPLQGIFLKTAVTSHLTMSDSVSAEDTEISQVKDAHSGSTVSSTCVRPPISFASPSAFTLSVYARFLSLWTPSFIRSIVYGQALSLVLTATSVITTELVMRNWVLPSTQIIFP